ncbi:MAG: RNA polymerase sigma factor [Cyclobacteriaceae bacterium]
MKLEKDYNEQKGIEAIRHNKDLNKSISYLYSCHYESLERYILKNSGSSYDAEDIFLETMMIAITSIQEDRFRAASGMRYFLFGIAKNLWISELRKRKSAAKRAEIYDGDHSKLEDNASTGLIKKENFKLIHTLFDQMGEKCKRLLLLFYYEELSMKDIMQKEDYSSAAWKVPV